MVNNTHAKRVLDEFYSEEEEDQPFPKQKNISNNKKIQEEDMRQNKKNSKPKVDENKTKRRPDTRVEKKMGFL